VKTTPTLARRLRQVAATLTSPGQIDTLLYASALLAHSGGRPPQRFVIRRISIGAKTNLPWTLTDVHRPSYIGRYPTQTAALAEVNRLAPPPDVVALVGELRKAAKAVYLATQQDIADDLSGLLTTAAARLEKGRS